MKHLKAGVLIALTLSTSVALLSAQATEPAGPQTVPQTEPQTEPQTVPQTVPGPTVAPQTPQQVDKDENGIYTVRSSSRLVALDVVVTDKKGNLVTGLKREDFTVTEAKTPQTVLNFDAAGAHPLSPSVTIDSTADLDRLAPDATVNIVLLDEFNTRFEDMAFARYSLKKFLDTQPDKLTTPTMLVSVDLRRFTVLHDYTQNKQAILGALEHHFAAYPWEIRGTSWYPERVATAFKTVMRVAEATEGHPGHKNMIWIGRGFPALNLGDVDSGGQERIEAAVEESINLLRDARITLYAIDPAGLQTDPAPSSTPKSYGAGSGDIDIFGGNAQFTQLALATGGRALYGRNDVDAEIDTSAREGNSFYTLTYRPTGDSQDPKHFRKIAVALNRPGLVATAREGYYVDPPAAAANPVLPVMKPERRLAFDLVAAESSTMVYDGVPVKVMPSLKKPGSYTVRVSGNALTWTDAAPGQARHTDVALLVATFNGKGKELKRVARKIRVTAAQDVAPTGRLASPVDLPVTVDRDPGAVRVRFVVRVDDSGRIGTADATLN